MTSRPEDLEAEIEEAFARLGMLEFALEVMWAMALAEAAPDLSERIKRGLLERADRTYGPITADTAGIARMQRHVKRSREMMERFVEKVARREAEIREG